MIEMRRHFRFRALIATTSLAILGGCADGDAASLSALDDRRVPGVLQLESPSALPTSVIDRARNSGVSWSPPIDGMASHLFLPAQVIEVPDTVRAGRVVDIVVNTIGENGCWQAAGGTLAQRNDSVFVDAFDRHSGAPVCTEIWTDRLPHRFTATFARAGKGLVEARGRRVRSGSAGAFLNGAVVGSEVIARRTIVILP
jgi:hypothetical protein